MKPKIKTYQDLLAEKERLQTLMEYQKGVLRNDVKLIKEEFEPVRKVLGIVGKFTKRDNRGNVMSFASGKLIDIFLRRVVLAKAGWVTKLAVPFLAKNFSSHVIADNKTQILGKLATWFNKARGHKVSKKSKKDAGHAMANE